MRLNKRIVLASVLLLLIAAPAAQAGDEWKFGLGTGLFGLNLDGDVGLDTVSGPLQIGIDLDNSDVSDLLDSAFGLSGFAAKDKWRILYAFQTMTLEGDGSNAARRANLTFDATGANVFGEYNFARAGKNSFGVLFGPMILFWLDLFYRGTLDQYSPARLAREIHVPVMIIHGEEDQRFPVSFALRLKQSFPHDRVSLFVAKGAGHSESSTKPGYTEAVEAFLDRYLPQTS